MTRPDRVGAVTPQTSAPLARRSIIPRQTVDAVWAQLDPAQRAMALGIALDGLRAWHAWQATDDPAQRQAALAAADRLGADARRTGQPSALTLGLQIALGVHAHLLTGDARYAQRAQQAARTLALDIFEGGASAPLGVDGVFFQTVAAYPAAHQLAGMLVALLGLHALADATNDAAVAQVAARGAATLAEVLDEFDAGSWSYADLLRRPSATPRLHAVHVALLSALGDLTGEARWGMIAQRWERAQRQPLRRWRSSLGRAGADLPLVAIEQARPAPVTPEPICVPITAFPVMGGMRAVLTSVAQIMADTWQMDFVTRHVGPDSAGWSITRFGNGLTSPQHFPWVWLYVNAGRRKLATLLRSGRYRTVLAQDGAFTGALAALAARRTGQHVVCMEHGTVTLPCNATHRRERLAAIAAQPWPQRIVARLSLPAYWPAMNMLGRIAARRAHRYLVAGDETEAVLRDHLGVRASQIIRWRFAVDAQRYAPLPEAARRAVRERLGYASDVILIALICRLSPEKGLDVALAGLRAALDQTPPALRARVRVVIAGDGPLRAQLAAQAQQLELGDNCRFMGELTPDAVIELLQACDCFLYSSVRGTNISMAVLEAMATGCAIIATDEPVSNVQLLAEERGLAIPARDAAAISGALLRILGDPQAGQAMGRAARAYILREHSAAALKRSLLRATQWAPPCASAAQVRSKLDGE